MHFHFKITKSQCILIPILVYPKIFVFLNNLFSRSFHSLKFSSQSIFIPKSVLSEIFFMCAFSVVRQSVFVCIYICIKLISINPFKPNNNENIDGHVPVNIFQFLIEKGNPDVFYLLCILFPYFKVYYWSECSSRDVFPSARFCVPNLKCLCSSFPGSFLLFRLKKKF